MPFLRTSVDLSIYSPYDKPEHRRRIKTEEKAKVVAVVSVTYLNGALTI